MNINNIGAQLKKFRLRANLSQLDLEMQCGLSVGTISRIENRAINPTKETLYKIGKALNLSKLEIISLFGIEIEVS